MLSNHYKEMYDEINKEKIDSKYVFDLVHDYLIHSGFIGTLQAFEEESSFALMNKEDFEAKDEFAVLANNNTTTKIPRKKTLGPDMLPLKRSRNWSSSSVVSEKNIGNLTTRLPHTEEIKEIKDEDQKEKFEETKDEQCGDNQMMTEKIDEKDAENTAINGKSHLKAYKHFIRIINFDI
jgi:hypothetical protein